MTTQEILRSRPRGQAAAVALAEQRHPANAALRADGRRPLRPGQHGSHPGRQRRGHGCRQRAHQRRDAGPPGPDAGAHRGHGQGHPGGCRPARPGGPGAEPQSSAPTASSSRRPPCPWASSPSSTRAAPTSPATPPPLPSRAATPASCAAARRPGARASAIVTALRQGLRAERPARSRRLLSLRTPPTPRANALMTAVGYVDLLIPARRGRDSSGPAWRTPRSPASRPAPASATSSWTTAADQTKALEIIENAKASRPSVCNAEEVCLVHSAIAAEFLPKLAQRLGPDRAARGSAPRGAAAGRARRRPHPRHRRARRAAGL